MWWSRDAPGFPAGVPNACLNGSTLVCPVECELSLPFGDVYRVTAAWMLVMMSKHGRRSSISGISSPSASSSKVSSICSLGNGGEANKLASAITAASWAPGVL